MEKANKRPDQNRYGWSLDEEYQGCCIGYVVRNSKREVLLAIATHHLSPSALYYVILAIRVAMCYIHVNQKWMDKEIIFESDSAETIGFFTGKYRYHRKNQGTAGGN